MKTRGNSAHPWARRTARLAGSCALVLLALALVAAALLTAVSKGWRREDLRAAVERAASQALGGPVRIGALEGPLYPELRLHMVEWSGGPENQLQIPVLEVRFALLPLWTERTLVVESLRVERPVLRLSQTQKDGWEIGSVSGQAEEPPPAETPQGSRLPFDVVVRETRLSQGSFSLQWTQAGGTGVLEGRVDLASQRLLFSAEEGLAWPESSRVSVHLDPSRVADRLLQSAQIDVTLSGSVLMVDDATLESEFGRGQLEGRMDLAAWMETERSASAQLEATFEGLDLETATGRPHLESELTGELALRATRAAGEPLRGTQAEIDLHLTDSRLGETEIRSVDLKGSYRAGRWQIHAASIQATSFSAVLDGAGDLSAAETLEVKIEASDLAALGRLLPGWPALSGQAALRGELKGPWKAPGGRLELVGWGLALEQTMLGDLRLTLSSAADRRLEIHEIGLNGPAMRLQSQGAKEVRWDDSGVTIDGMRLASSIGMILASARIERSGVRNVLLELTDLDLPAIAAITGLEARSGRLTARAEIREPMSWKRLDYASLARSSGTSLELEGQGVDLRLLRPMMPEGARELGGVADLRIHLRGSSPIPELDGELKITEGKLGLGAAGTTFTPIEGRLELTANMLTVDGIRVGTAGGEVRLDAVAQLERPEGRRWGIRIDQLAVRLPSLSLSNDGPLALHVDPEGVTLKDIHLVSDGGPLAVDGSIERTAFQQLRVQVENFEIEPFASALGVSAPMGGRVTGTVMLDGSFGSPKVDGRAVLESPRWGPALADRLELQIESVDGRILVTSRLERLEKEILLVRALVPRGPGLLNPPMLATLSETELEIRADHLELAWLAPWTPRVARDPGGWVRGRLQLRGGTPRPVIEGFMEVEGGSLRVPALAQTFSPATARLEFNGDRIRLERLLLGDEESGALLSGEISLAPGQTVSTRLLGQLRRFKLGGSPRFTAELDGEVMIEGPLEALTVQGDVSLAQGRFSLPQAGDRLMREIRVLSLSDEPELPRAGSQSRRYEDASLDVRLNVARGTWIHGQGASLEVEGDLRLTKSPAGGLRYTGALAVVRGSYRLSGRRFEIQRGSVVLSGAADPDPEIEATGFHRVGDVTVVATLKGTLSSPRVSLSSDPPMEETDVLSYLLFGRPASQVGEVETTQLQKTALGSVGRLAAGPLSEMLTGALHVDTVELGLDDSEGVPEFGIGKYVSRDVFVHYEQEFGTQPGGDIEIEWKVLPQWIIESEVTTAGHAGADLLWTVDY